MRNGEEKAREKKPGTQRPNFVRDKERRRRGWGCVGDLKMVSYYFFSSVSVVSNSSSWLRITCWIFSLFLGVRDWFFYPIRFQFLCSPFLFVSWSGDLFKQRICSTHQEYFFLDLICFLTPSFWFLAFNRGSYHVFSQGCILGGNRFASFLDSWRLIGNRNSFLEVEVLYHLCANGFLRLRVCNWLLSCLQILISSRLSTTEFCLFWDLTTA